MDDISRHLALDLHRATALIDRVADVQLRAAHGIGVSEFAALTTIDALGPARQNVVAAGLGVSRAAVTQRLVDLVADDLVAVSTDLTDGQAKVVELTPEGSALLASAWEVLARADDGLEVGVDVATLQSALQRLIANAERFLANRSRA